MPNTVIDTLEVKITANAMTAAQALDKLANSLKNVRAVLNNTNKAGASIGDKLAKNIHDLNNAMTRINNDGIKKLQFLSNALNSYANAAQRVSAIRGGSAITQSVKDAERALGYTQKNDRNNIGTKSGMAVQDGASESTKKKTEEARKLGEEFERAGKKARTATGLFVKFLKSVGRIAVYRAIRSALKAIGEAFSEGLKNAYGYSQQSETFKRLADTLDRLKSVTSQMTNQLGAFWGEMKQFVMPAVEWLVEKVRWVSERLTEFFAALNGQPTYLQAQLVAEKWGEATDNVKAFKQQLLGIDELNNLTSKKGESDNETDFSTLYKEVNVNEKLLEIGGSLKSLTVGIGDILFDWSDLNGTDIAKKIITGIGGLIGGVVGFKFGGVPGAIVGTIAGVAITAIISELFFDSEGSYGKSKLRKILYPALGALTGAWIGYKVSGLTGALVGMSVGATLGFVLSKISFGENGLRLEKVSLRNMIYPVLGAIVGGWIGFKTSGVSGALIGMTAGATLGLILNQLSFGNSESVKGRTKEFLGNQLIGSVLVGVTGALIGWKVGGITGALVGASIGFTLSLLMNSLFFSNGSDDTTKTVTQKLVNVLTACAPMATAGFLTGWAVGGAAGALIGLTVGISLTLLVEKLGIDWGNYDGETLNGLPTELLPGGKGGTIRKDGNSNIVYQASGGINRPGTLFYAGEAGPEFVGSMGGNTAVANTSQMTEAIYKAAYMGMSQALKENGGNGLSGFVPASTDDLFIAMRKKASVYNKTTGNSAFA